MDRAACARRERPSRLRTFLGLRRPAGPASSASFPRYLPRLALAGLLLAGLSSGIVAPASAATLVSNTGETAAGVIGLPSNRVFQGFTTGSNSGGYTLETVSVIAYASSDEDDTGDLILKLCPAENDGTPDTSATCTDLGTVANGDLPTSDDSCGTVTVNPTDFDLAKDTTYFVSLNTNHNSGGPIACATASDAETGATGWSMEDAYRVAGGNNDFVASGHAFRIQVDGTVKGATDTTAPTVSSAAADGASLVITFDENLAAAANLANSAFAVTKGSGNDTVALSSTAPSISGATVTLTLASALAHGDTNVEVSYTKPTTGTDNKLKDAADNEVASFSGQAVTNNTNAPPTASNNTVETKEDVAYTFAASDFNFSDTDSGDALEKVKIVTVETAGDLELDGTDVTANQEVTKANLDNGKLIFTPATDANGASYATFTFKVNDGDDDSASAYTMTIDVDSVPDANTVAVITTPISGTTPKKYGAGEQIGVMVIFDEAVTVTGDPVINVEVGSNSRPAAYATGSGSTRLVFGYTVIAEDSDSDGISIDANALTLDANDKIEGSDNDTADIRHAALPAQSGHKVDGTLTPPFPTATDGEVSAKEDTAYTFQAGDFNYMGSGNALTHVIVTSIPGKGTLKKDGGAIEEADLDESVSASRLGTTRGLTWEPPADENGNDFATFSFQVQNAIALSASAYTMTIDVDPVPDVTDVAVTSTPTSGTTPKKYGAGEKIQVTATFDEAVTVTGDPVINVEVGSNSRPAAYASGSGTTELVFEYTVVAADTDSDGVSIDANALTLDADSGSEDYIRDGDGNDADITHAALAAQSDHKVDGSLTPPSTNTAPTAMDGEVTTKEDTEYTFQSSDFNFTDTDANDELDHVIIVSLPGSGSLKVDGKALVEGDLPDEISKGEIDDDDLLTYEPPSDANGNDYATFTFKVNDGDDDSASAYTMTIDVDSVPDVTDVAVTSTPTSGTTPKKYGAGEKIQVTATFDEAVTVTGDPVINVEVGSNSRPAAYVSGSTTTELVFEYTVVSGDTDSNGVSIDANALTLDSNDKIEGSDNDTADITHAALAAQSAHQVDGSLTPPTDTAPRVTSIERQTPSSSPTNADTLTWRVTFNENVKNVDAADFEVGGTTASLAVSQVTATTVYDVTASGGNLAALDATATLSFASTQNIADTADNALSNTAPTGTNDNSYVVDNTAPTVFAASVTDLKVVALIFTEKLDSTSAPAAGAFTVNVGSGTRPVSSVGVASTAVTLTMAEAFIAGETVTVDYAKPGTNPLKDRAGNEVANFSGRAVSNNAPACPGGQPASAFWTACLTVGKDALGIYGYDSGANNGALSDDTFTLKGDDTQVTALTYSSSLGLQLAVSYRFRSTDLVLQVGSTSLDLPSGTSPFTWISPGFTWDDANIGDKVSVSLRLKPAADTTAPTLRSATVDGAELVLTYDETLSRSAETIVATAFTVKVNGTAQNLSDPVDADPVTHDGAAITLTLGSAVAPSDTVTVTYVRPSSGEIIRDLSGNRAAAFADRAVTNNTAPPAAACPSGQPAHAFWTACLTIGKGNYIGSTFYGFIAHVAGALSDTDFTYKEQTFTVLVLARSREGAAVHISFSGTLPGSERLVLQVGATSLSFQGGVSAYSWNTPSSLVWTDANVGDKVSVSLREYVAPRDDSNNEYVISGVPYWEDRENATCVTGAPPYTYLEGGDNPDNHGCWMTVDEEGGAETFRVRMKYPVREAVTVTLSPRDSGAISVSPAQLTFTPDNWHTDQEVSVSGLADADGLDEWDFIYLTGETGANTGSVRVEIKDDDTHAQTGHSLIYNSSGNRLRVAQAGTGQTFTVRLSFQPEATTTLVWDPLVAGPVKPVGGGNTGIKVFKETTDSSNPPQVISAAGGVAITPREMVFTRDNWQTPQAFTVTADADTAGTVIPLRPWWETSHYPYTKSPEFTIEVVTTLATALPDPPPLSAAAGDRAVRLSWTVPEDAGGITGWQARYGEVNPRNAAVDWGEWYTIPGAEADAASHTVTGLANGTSYGFQVRAVVGGLETSPSNTHLAMPMAGMTLDAPGRPELDAYSGNAAVDLSWEAPRFAGTITGWQYRYGLLDGPTNTVDWGDWTDIGDATAQTRSHTVTGLVNDTEYGFQLRAVAGENAGDMSERQTAWPYHPPIERISVTEVTATTVGLEWVLPQDAGLTGVRVEHRLPEQEWQSSEDLALDAASYTVTGLAPATRYNFRVVLDSPTGGTSSGALAQDTLAADPLDARMTGSVPEPDDGTPRGGETPAQGCRVDVGVRFLDADGNAVAVASLAASDFTATNGQVGAPVADAGGLSWTVPAWAAPGFTGLMRVRLTETGRWQAAEQAFRVAGDTDCAPVARNALASLALDGLDLDQAFDAATTAYTADAPADKGMTTVTASAVYGASEVTVAPADADEDAAGHQVALAEGETAVTVTVTPADGSAAQTWTVTVTRAAGAGVLTGFVLVDASNDADLGAVTGGGTVSVSSAEATASEPRRKRARKSAAWCCRCGVRARTTCTSRRRASRRTRSMAMRKARSTAGRWRRGRTP